MGRLFSKVLLPTVLGAQIHSFAYTILFVVIIAALGIVPKNIRVTARKIQEFMTAVVAMMTMVGLGFDFNLGELVAACSPGNIAIAFCVVIGAIIGSGLAGKLVGFYPIDSAVTAGLCMANRGGAGDVAVLTATDRMGLISRTAFQPCWRRYRSDHCILCISIFIEIISAGSITRKCVFVV